MIKKSVPLESQGYEDEKIRTALVKLYSEIKQKIKVAESSPPSTQSSDLSSVDSLTMINYIKNSLDVLVQIGIEEQVDDYILQKENEPQEYETILIKYENDIRGHIRIEHQLKLYADNLQTELEQCEREKNGLLQMISKYRKNNHSNTNVISVYEKEIVNLKNEISILQSKINTYIQSEKKYKGEVLKLNTEIVVLTEKNQKLKRRVAAYEEKIKNISSKSTRKNSNSFIHKRVISTSTISSQLSKRNKNTSSIMNRSVSNYYNNALESSSRSLSKKHDEILKKIDLYSKVTSSSRSKRKNLNSSYRNRSVGVKEGKNYDKIQMIKELLLKKTEYVNKSTISKNDSSTLNKNISINKSRMSNHSNSLNNSNNSSMILHNLNGTLNNGHTRKTKKGSIKKLSSSLIINQPNNSYVNNNINIFTTSTKNNNNS